MIINTKLTVGPQLKRLSVKLIVILSANVKKNYKSKADNTVAYIYADYMDH